MSNHSKYYRNDLLKQAYDSQPLKFRAIYEQTGIAVNTQRAALSGDSMQIDKLKTFADFLNVNWLELFDLKCQITD